MDLHIFKRQLEELEAHFQRWIEPIERVHLVSSYKVNKRGYSFDDHEREVNQVAQSQIAQYDPYQDMYALFDKLCPIYLAASPQHRSEIRSVVSNKEGIWSGLINYAYRAAERLQSPDDKEWLRLGLAAISIEDCSMDFRVTLMALAELHGAAEKAGIDPEPAFREVAELSNHVAKSGGTGSVSEMLFKFQSCATLKERRSKPEGWREKEVAPWQRRVYHYEKTGEYVEASRKKGKGEDERNPWWKRIIGLGE